MTDERDRGDSNDSDDSDAADHSDTTDSPTGSMTDNTVTDDTAETNRAPRTTGPESDPDGDDGRFGRLSTDDLRGLIDRIGLAALILLALIAGWSFYSQAGRAIRTWLDPAYHPIALAAFNLAVLLVALAGVAHQLYRIRRSERDGGE